MCVVPCAGNFEVRICHFDMTSASIFVYKNAVLLSVRDEQVIYYQRAQARVVSIEKMRGAAVSPMSGKVNIYIYKGS